MMSQFVNDVADYFPVEEVDGALSAGGVFLRVSHHDDGGAFGIEFLDAYAYRLYEMRLAYAGGPEDEERVESLYVRVIGDGLGNVVGHRYRFYRWADTGTVL